MGSEPVVSVCKSTKQIELTPEDVKDAHWFYDTPGITKESCVCICFILETFIFNIRSIFLTAENKQRVVLPILKLGSDFFMKTVHG
jgi:hypothetical protein